MTETVALPAFAVETVLNNGTPFRFPHLTIYLRERQYARIQMPHEYNAALTWIGTPIGRAEALSGLTTRSGAKLYPRGNTGWFDLMGYAADGRDVRDSLADLIMFAVHGATHLQFNAQASYREAVADGSIHAPTQRQTRAFRLYQQREQIWDSLADYFVAR